MVRGISFVFLFVAAFAVGCVGDNPDTNPPPTAPDGGLADVGLVENGTMENNCGAPLFESNGDLSPEVGGNTGAKSCKVCQESDGGEGSLYLYAPLGNLVPNVGDVYVVSVWMRQAQGAMTGGSSQIAIGGIDSTGSPNEDGAIGPGPSALTDAWKQATLTWTVTKAGAKSARVDVGLPQAAVGVCFLVDDLSVKKQ